MDLLLLREMDLNLLVVLEVLLRKRSVVATARELGYGQPAVSKKLATLRQALGDPLLVRQGRSMQLTSRAERLAETLPQVLHQLHSCIAPPREFDPTSSTDTFRIGLQYYPVDLAAVLMQDICERAPGLNVHFLEQLPDEAQQHLNTGTLDLLVHVADKRRKFGVQRGATKGYGRYGEYFYIQELYDEEFVTIARAGHPELHGGLDLDTYTHIPHVLFSAVGDTFGFVDAALKTLGRNRRVGALVQNWTLGCEIVVRSGHLMTLNHDVALHLKTHYPIELFRSPVELPSSHVSQLWHTRHHKDPLHRWVRERVRKVGERLQKQLEENPPAA